MRVALGGLELSVQVLCVLGESGVPDSLVEEFMIYLAPFQQLWPIEDQENAPDHQCGRDLVATGVLQSEERSHHLSEELRLNAGREPILVGKRLDNGAHQSFHITSFNFLTVTTGDQSQHTQG